MIQNISSLDTDAQRLGKVPQSRFFCNIKLTPDNNSTIKSTWSSSFPSHCMTSFYLVRKMEIVSDGTVTKSDVNLLALSPKCLNPHAQHHVCHPRHLWCTFQLRKHPSPCSPSFPVPASYPSSTSPQGYFQTCKTDAIGFQSALQWFPVAPRIRPNSPSLPLPSSTTSSNTTRPWPLPLSSPRVLSFPFSSSSSPDLCTHLWGDPGL